MRYIIGLAVVLVLFETVPAWANGAQVVGAGLGAVAGGLLGSQIGQGTGRGVATGLGIATGAAVGSEIGRAAGQNHPAASLAPPTASATSLTDVAPPYKPNYVAPPAETPPVYRDSPNLTYCRAYSHNEVINGQVQESYGTVCLQPDGSWRSAE